MSKPNSEYNLGLEDPNDYPTKKELMELRLECLKLARLNVTNIVPIIDTEKAKLARHRQLESGLISDDDARKVLASVAEHSEFKVKEVSEIGFVYWELIKGRETGGVTLD